MLIAHQISESTCLLNIFISFYSGESYIEKNKKCKFDTSMREDQLLKCAMKMTVHLNRALEFGMEGHKFKLSSIKK